MRSSGYFDPEARLGVGQAGQSASSRVELLATEAVPRSASSAPTRSHAAAGAHGQAQAILEREALTDHDVAAFLVQVLRGEAGKWIRFGLTSSDVGDTCWAGCATRPTT